MTGIVAQTYLPTVGFKMLACKMFSFHGCKGKKNRLRTNFKVLYLNLSIILGMTDS